MGGGEGGAEAGAVLRGELDVDEAGEARRGEEPGPPLPRPDDRLVDPRSGLDLLVRPELDPGVDVAALADHAVVADDGVLLEKAVVLDGDVAPDDALAQPAVLADVAVLPEHAVAHLGVVVDHRVLVDDDGAVDERARLDLGVAADVHGAVDADVDAELHPLPHPDVAVPAAGDLAAHPALERVPVRLQVGLDGADVAPVALGDDSVEGIAFAQHRREDVLGPVVRHPRLDVVEYRWLDDVDAGVGLIAEDLTPRGLLEEAAHRAVRLGDHHPVLEGVGHAVEDD